MDAFLAEYFNTVPSNEAEKVAAAAVAEEQARAEIFAKLASDQGIDLTRLSDEQVTALYSQVFPKTAADAPPPFPPKKEEEGEKKKDGDEEEKKKEAAAAEFAAMQAKQAEFDQAAFFGKTAAHAYVAELRGIAEAGGLDFLQKEAGAAARAASSVGKKLENLGKGTVRTLGRTHGEEQAMNPRTAKAIGGAVAGVGAAGAAGVAHGAHKALKKEGSFDAVAGQLALDKLAADGWNLDEGAARLNAVLTLGVEDSAKVASASGYEQGLEIRALELLEAAGYPITWG